MTASLPLPFMPELAAQYGLQEAVMLAVLAELVGDWQGSVTVNEQRLFSRASGISRQQQGEILAQLANHGLVSIGPASTGMLAINLNVDAYQALAVNNYSQTNAKQPVATAQGTSTTAQPAAAVSQQAPAPMSKPANMARRSNVAAGKNNRGRDDELSRIFEEREALQAMQAVMTADWRPSANILRMLTQNMQVSEAFAMGLRDEFVVYYMDKERRESPGGWDQKFLKWVKKEHVQQQTATARAQQQTPTRSYAQNEEARYNARAQRQQLTDAVLDLGNTDW